MCGYGFDCGWGLLILTLVGNKVPSKNVHNEANGFYALVLGKGRVFPMGFGEGGVHLLVFCREACREGSYRGRRIHCG